MSKYTKKSNYWLKKKRISNDKKFNRMKDVDKKRIIQKNIRSLIIILIFTLIFFIILSIFYKELIFLHISIIPFILLIIFYLFYLRRKKILNTYRRISYLQKMDPFLFEEYITNLFNKLGYELITSVGSGDDGADSIGTDNNGQNIIIQTKRYSDKNTVGSPEIRNFIGSMHFYNVKKGIFLTTGYFSKPAENTVKQVSDNLEIILIDKDKLTALLNLVYKKKKK